MSQVHGFRAYPPRAGIFLHPFTGAVIATPVLDLSSVRGPAGYADRSPTGANGAPVGAPANIRGVFDEAVRFGGVRDTLNCGSNAPLDIAGDISACVWVTPRGVPAGYILTKTNNASGWQLVHNGVADQRLVFYTYNGPFAISSTIGVYNSGPKHCAFSVVSNVARLFIDGLQNVRGAVSMTDAAAEPLCVASWRNLASWSQMDVELPQVWNGALSPEQVYANYLAAKDVPIYLDDFSSYAVTPVAKAVGSMCGPYLVLAQTANIGVLLGQKYLSLGAIGASTARTRNENNGYGTFRFSFRHTTWGGGAAGVMPFAGLAGTHVVAGQTGYLIYFISGGTISLYRVSGGTTLLCQTAAGMYAQNVDYDFMFVRRVGGQMALYIKGGAYPDFTLVPFTAVGASPATDNTVTSGGIANFYGNTDDRITNIRETRTCERPASFPWEFSATGTWSGLVSAGQVWMRCLTAGVTFLPKDLDWQTCIFGLYKGGDANVTDVLFVASEIGGSTFANQNGYVLRVAADESVQLIRTTGGVEAAPTAQTAAGYVALTTEYQIKITHNGTTNAYEFFIRGGAYADWTLMFAATLGIHTSSNYHVTDLDGDDRTTAPQFYQDLR